MTGRHNLVPDRGLQRVKDDGRERRGVGKVEIKVKRDKRGREGGGKQEREGKVQELVEKLAKTFGMSASSTHKQNAPANSNTPKLETILLRCCKRW